MDEAVAQCLVLLRDVAGLWRKTLSESRVEIMARLQPFVSRAFDPADTAVCLAGLVSPVPVEVSRNRVVIEFLEGEGGMEHRAFFELENDSWRLRSLEFVCPVCFGTGENDGVCSICGGSGWGVRTGEDPSHR